MRFEPKIEIKTITLPINFQPETVSFSRFDAAIRNRKWFDICSLLNIALESGAIVSWAEVVV